VSRNLVFFDEAKTLALPAPRIESSLEADGNGYKLTLSSDTLARDVWVSFGDLDAELSDNAFDLLPGQRMTLTVHSKASLEKLKQALQVQDLANVMSRPRR
jgi:beta-mannosidase